MNSAINRINVQGTGTENQRELFETVIQKPADSAYVRNLATLKLMGSTHKQIALSRSTESPILQTSQRRTNHVPTYAHVLELPSLPDRPEFCAEPPTNRMR
ncbi:hypothetical protein Mapa_014362 [Marchantia paleacea]|nr:hypothetical protein Mapa_014362 [Marchantia paleacea]